MAVDVLADFQAFLRSKKIVPDKQIQFYALWASRFLSFQNRNSFTKIDIATDQFIIWLRDTQQHMQDWQLQPGGEMPFCFIRNRLRGEGCNQVLQSVSTILQQTKACDCLTAEKRIREAIRLRHYSYSTEKTYIDWCRRFYALACRNRL